MEHGLIPPPDLAKGRWSREAVSDLPDRVTGIVEVVGEHPGLGSGRAATRMGERTGLELIREDVQRLAELGLLRPVGTFRGHPVYPLEEIDAVTEERVASVVAERLDWIAQSLTHKEAAALLGCSRGMFEVTAERMGLLPGRLDRFSRADVELVGSELKP
ncbi:hypothetical protein [Nocardiopsis sp. L17-MgMaSL7]|uniref:hypothetical protein n=1 Tax=Nocardiopsis sp. L17-MgMaSL7 TaxID=1938893 RepID=UPI000D70D235|nr:hypothetical protein [Nocardiopsis sp. L17-MgMaSL7]PWV45464.1 hypothetical protein BDW27_11725 [Nocardiopsis sp. L17-MgMaSL7]